MSTPPTPSSAIAPPATAIGTDELPDLSSTRTPAATSPVCAAVVLVALLAGDSVDGAVEAPTGSAVESEGEVVDDAPAGPAFAAVPGAAEGGGAPGRARAGVAHRGALPGSGRGPRAAQRPGPRAGTPPRGAAPPRP